MCSGGIHDSGSLPIINNSLMCRASARSLLARFLFPRLAAVSAGSARCTTRANPPELVRDEPPARRRLQRDLELLATEPLAEPPHASPMRRRDPRPHHLTRIGIQPLRSDLRPVLIKPHHDRHLQRLLTPRLARPRPRTDPRRPTAEPGRPRHMPSIKSGPGSTGGGGRHNATTSDTTSTAKERVSSPPPELQRPSRTAPDQQQSLTEPRGRVAALGDAVETGAWGTALMFDERLESGGQLSRAGR